MGSAALFGCSESSAPLTQGTKVNALAPGQGGAPSNILLLCIDDLRDWVGYKNAHPGVHTPHIDRLRDQSCAFNRAYCTVPVCIASRGSTLWGLRPETAGLDGLDDAAPYAALMKSPTVRPLPEYFSAAGYRTISTGKVFHWEKGTSRFWDVYQTYEESPVIFGDRGTLFDYGLQRPGEMHTDQKSADFAVDQLQQKHDAPWFMAIGLQQPHVPWRLPQWAFDLHPLEDVVLPSVRADDLEDIPAAGVALARNPSGEIEGKQFDQHSLVVDSGLWREHVQAYLAACSHTDAMTGQILAALDNSVHRDNTAVVLWSDHGYHLGEKLHWRKMALWEQATRVPLLVRSPQLPAGSGFDHPVSLLDLAPTLLALAGITAPAHFEGESLVEQALGRARPRPVHMRWGDAVSTRVGKWRWTRYADGGEELYDLERDPEEYDNLLGRDGKLQGGLSALA